MIEIEVGSVWFDRINRERIKVVGFSGDYINYRLALVIDAPIFSMARSVFSINCENLEQGRKDDSAKRRYSLLPKGTVNSVVDVLGFGSKKYADNNWQKVPDAKARYYDAAMRHLDAWFNGELKDSETGLPHLAHAICCLMFLLWFDSEATND